MSDLEGVICATLTPFVSSVGPVDYDWIEPHLRFLEAGGVQGIVPLGTTGEAASLGVGERERILDLVLERRGGMFVVAGTGCASLPETVTLSRYALEQGADAVLVMPPYYYKDVPEAGVLDYFRALCDSLPGDARVLLYHIPRNTGVPISPAVIEGLLQSHPRQFYGIKDSSGDAPHTAGLLARYPQLKIYSGSDAQLASALGAGAHGVISALANVLPGLVRGVSDAHAGGGDVAAAQARVNAARTLVKTYASPPALKAALPWVSDLPLTSVRAPLANLSEDQAASLKQGMAEAGLL
jgi:4-hydroxy-tetrahydrodipicolinate synthase